ncbi:hypothetical protein H0H87_010796 [Tephrocybe sp. NHM501043]|nr:hypothetical protein H0H87_010796 [Tephrocybe sp. NHM501043]
MHSSMVDNSTLYDLVGLGFGPANLAIAGAVVEKRLSTPSGSFPLKKTLFIEKHDKFRWHPGMLLPDARMQISFMKDLATLRNPQSPITFLSYLQSQNRLVSFINRGSTIPSRREYADYLSWAAQYVQTHGVDVLYGHEVIALSRGRGNSTINIRSRNLITGEQRVIRARDVVISPGGSPRVPEPLSPISEHPFVMHSSAYATSISHVLESLRTSRDRTLRIAVIGSGQSAAEVTLDLRDRLSSIPSLTRHEIFMIIRKGSLKPSDDSPFANEIFDPSSTDTWYNFPSERIRASTLKEYKSTNYGVVNPRTLEILHEVIYNQKLDDGITSRCGSAGTNVTCPRVNIQTYSSILSTSTCTSVSNDILPSQHVDKPMFSILTQNVISRAILEEKYDAVVCATGYQRSSWVNLLKDSDIGKSYGLHSGSCSVQLIPISTQGHRDVEANTVDFVTSTGTDVFASIDGNIPNSVYISRHYRLLPSKFGRPETVPSPFEPRVYLQGVEEATHGLSDTLLSVLGVRAGEVVGDLCSGRVEKDWMAESKL